MIFRHPGRRFNCNSSHGVECRVPLITPGVLAAFDDLPSLAALALPVLSLSAPFLNERLLTLLTPGRTFCCFVLDHTLVTCGSGPFQ